MHNENRNLDRYRVLSLPGAMAGSSLVNASRASAAPRKRRIGVALACGGLHGYAHIGVIRAFEASKANAYI